jgi:hypothetical protein
MAVTLLAQGPITQTSCPFPKADFKGWYKRQNSHPFRGITEVKMLVDKMSVALGNSIVNDSTY